MVPMLILGLVWLSLTALLCLVVGRAMRAEDVRAEKRVRESRLAAPPVGLVGRSHGRYGGTQSLAPEPLDQVEDDELDRWAEVWRWEEEFRRGMERWRDGTPPGSPPADQRRVDPDDAG